MTAVFEEAEKRELAGRARTLHERLAAPDAVVGEQAAEAVDELLAEWREQFPDDAAFERRLAREGVSEAEGRAALAADRLADDEPIPEWVERLDDLVAAVQAADPDDQPRWLAPEAAPAGADGGAGADAEGAAGGASAGAERGRPFGPLSAALATHVRDGLPGEPVHGVLSRSAVDVLAAWFRERFERRFVRILYVEFKTFVAVNDRDLAYADPDEFDDPPTEYYERFVAYLFDGGFADLCREYPVFGRLLTTQVRQFEEHLVEFARRLADDRGAIADRFGVDGDLGEVTALEPLADDTHGDGRAVMRVEFACGLTVAYKPRSVDAGERFYALLDRLNDHLPTPSFRTPTYLPRDGYGWMEWVEHEDCPDEAAVGRYYRRAGALVCVAYLLEFSDCQYENLVVAGEHPVLVDAETVLHPYFGTDRRPVRTGLGALRTESVLLTALLPHESTTVGDDARRGVGRAIAGIGESAETFEVDDVRVPEVEAVNTDVMTVEQRPGRLDRGENVPAVDGEPRPPEEFLDAVVAGFEAAYDAVLDLRDDGRLAELGLPDALADVENRVVYRPTMQYGSKLRSLCSRACLADGARFGVELEGLAAPFCDGRVADPAPWGLFDAERRALTRLDPPRFACRTDGTAVDLAGTPTGVDADRPGMARAEGRLAVAGPADRREQVELLRSSFGALPSPPPADHPQGREAVDDDALVGEAESLLAAVREAGLRTGDGSYHWASVTPPTGKDGTNPLTVQPADGSLYAGTSGIALLGAGLYRVTGDEAYREFALDALDPVREAIRSGRESPALESLGGATGIGSVAYGLGAVGDLLDEPALLDDAVAAADRVTEDLIAADDTYDVVGGSAGTVLGLLAVHDRRPAPGLVSTAADLGDHLLDGRVEADGFHVWETLDGCPPLAGYAHGAAGVAYALARLWDATGEDAYRDAALEAVAFEADAYDPDAGNWPDDREWADEGFPDQWCYGRSGVGLARLGTAEYVADDRVDRGFERAVETFPDAGLGSLDHLCCGDAGRASFLLEAARNRGRREGEARRLLGGVLERKRDAGAYRTLTYTRELTDPTAFHGLAGIGYAMLRVVEPELPALLLWE